MAFQSYAQEPGAETQSPITDVDPAAEVAPERDLRIPLEQLGAMMERDWEDRPEWAQMAISILKGEDMGPGTGWYKPSETRYTWNWMLETFDGDKNGTIYPDELGGSAKFLPILDRTLDGSLSANDFDARSSMNRNDAPTMMGSVLFRILDSDSNGKVTSEELSLFFLEVDQERTGFLTMPDLQSLFRRAPQILSRPTNIANEYQPGMNPLVDLDMLMSGQLGSLHPGPAVNDMAPDFTLRRQDGSGTVTLSQLRGKPVVLVFGSFT